MRQLRIVLRRWGGGDSHSWLTTGIGTACPFLISSHHRRPTPPRDLGNGAGHWSPSILWGENLLWPAREDGDVLASAGVDAFERPAIGVEVPEVAGHGGGGCLQGSRQRTGPMFTSNTPPSRARDPFDPIAVGSIAGRPGRGGQGVTMLWTGEGSLPLTSPCFTPGYPDRGDTPPSDCPMPTT